jgi:hypothetical protein
MADLDIVAPRRSYALGLCCSEDAERQKGRLRLHRIRHAAFVSFEWIKDDTCL